MAGIYGPWIWVGFEEYDQMPILIRGRLPVVWLKAAIKAGGPASFVGLYLWYLKGWWGFSYDLWVEPKMAMHAMKIGPSTLKRGLRQLRDGHLISTKRGGRAVLVTILEVPAP